MALPPDNQHVTYQLQYRKCGKTSCSTCRDGQGHGPYWYAYWREGTRLRSGYVGKTNPYQSVESDQENAKTSSDTVATRSSASEITSVPA